MPVVIPRRRIAAVVTGLAIALVPPSVALTSAAGAPATTLPVPHVAAVPALAAASPLTVSQAIGSQTGQSATVRGYVVGQPTATSTVVRSGFPNDYALAIADSASETSTSRMLYVQIPSAFRSSWGLRSNPSLMGRQARRHGCAGRVLLPPGHDLDERLRVQRHVDDHDDEPDEHDDEPEPHRHDEPLRLDVLRIGHRQVRLGAAHRACTGSSRAASRP